MVAPLSIGPDLAGDVSLAEAGVLQREFDGGAVDARRQAVPLISKPCDAAVQLAVDGSRPLRVTVSLVEKERGATPTVVREGDLMRFGVDTCEKREHDGCDEGVGRHVCWVKFVEWRGRGSWLMGREDVGRGYLWA